METPGDEVKQHNEDGTGLNLCDSHTMQDTQFRVEMPEQQNSSVMDSKKFESMLDSQRDKILRQLQDLQKVVVLQCRITGANPLAQEMAAAVLDKRIGRKYGDSLTPKALKCLYNVFSIKDTITKKEAREISALCGATVTQVREFFSGQRSRLRKVVQSSHNDLERDGSCFELQPIPLEQSMNDLLEKGGTLSLSSQRVDGNQCTHLLLLDSFQGKADGLSSNLHAVEKAEHLINVMHKESSFAGQSQLAQVILQAHDSVLRSFMGRGGLHLIIKWLTQAASEEQTSLIRLLLKGSTRLPLGCAVRRQLSLLLQTVNKLRFYRAPDIAKSARSLLAKWSSTLMNGKTISVTGTVRAVQPGQKRGRDLTNLSVIEAAPKKKPKAGLIMDSGQASDVVPSPLTKTRAVLGRDDTDIIPSINTTKKRLGSFLSEGDRAKEKRKVQLLEAARAAIRRRDADTARSSSSEFSSRPLSADDIKKAKQRAYFLNSAKAQKPSTLRPDGLLGLDSSAAVPSQRNADRKSVKDGGNNGGVNEPSSGESCLDSIFPSLEDGSSEALLCPRMDSDKDAGAQAKHLDMKVADTDGDPFELSLVVKQSERCGRASLMDLPSVHWTKPPRYTVDPIWKVAAGEHSIEVSTQYKRTRDEQEAIYFSPASIPPNPEEPAERVCLFVDDSQVPEILMEVFDEESQDRDGSLHSPRDVEQAPVKAQEPDGQELDITSDVSVPCAGAVRQRDAVSSSMGGLGKASELETTKATLGNTPSMELGSESKDQLPLVSAGMVGWSWNVPAVPMSSDIDQTKNPSIHFSELSLAIPIDHSLKPPIQEPWELHDSKDRSSEAYDQDSGNTFGQLSSEDNFLAFKMQHANSATAALAMEPLAVSLRHKDVTSQLPKECDKGSGLPAASQEFPSPLDHFAKASVGTKISGLDLSGLSKEACLDMLTVVLQQLADDGKGSGADLELLSVFLSNPQLVDALMGCQGAASSSGNSCTGALKDLTSQFEKLIGRDLAKVSSNVTETSKVAPYTSHVSKPVSSGPSVALTGLPTNSVPPPLQQQPLAMVKPTMQLPQYSLRNDVDGAPYLKHLSSKVDTFRSSEDSTAHSSDYDWSRPYDPPSSTVPQTAALTRPHIHNSVAVETYSSLGRYTAPIPDHNQPPMARVPPQVHNSSALIMHADSRVPSSSRGYGQINPRPLHGDTHEMAINRKNPLSLVEIPNAPTMHTLQARGSGISDGILPVPDTSLINQRVPSSNPIHERHHMQQGTKPAFTPDVRHLPMTGNQMPYHDHKFRPPPPLSAPCPPYLSHGQLPQSFVPNSLPPTGNPAFWMPPHRGRHARPGRR